MTSLDYSLVALYLIFAMGVGLYASRKASRSVEDYFVAGRSLPWWLAGTSMVATTFAADTPLAVTGLIASGGIAGNWLWWCFGIAHVVAALGFARYWRRLEVITDAELIPRRYDGPRAALLRKVTAGYQAVFINCLVLGWILVAMRKVSLAIFPELSPHLITFSLMGLAVFYATLGGMRSVVLTDLVQLVLAFVGAIALASYAAMDMGGLSGLVEGLQTTYPDKSESLLAFVPDGDLPGLPLMLFAVLMTVGWWRNAQGAGYIVQRLGACKSQEDAERGSIWFAVLHNAIRPWPWILVGLAALLVWPLDGGTCVAECLAPYSCVDGTCVVQDREQTYPLMMVRYLPAGWLGLVVASMLAAFMSTVDTHVNWGASYVVQDLLHDPNRSEQSRVWLGRIAAVVTAILAGFLSLFMDSIADIWLVVIMVGGGIGSVWMGRWLWWRVNATAELSAFASATVLALTLFLVGKETILGATNPLFIMAVPKSFQLLLVIGGTFVTWTLVAAFSAPESQSHLLRFYQDVQPLSAGWGPIHTLTPEAKREPMAPVLLRIAAGLLAVYGTLFGIGGLLVRSSPMAWGATLTAGVAAMLYLMRSRAR